MTNPDAIDISLICVIFLAEGNQRLLETIQRCTQQPGADLGISWISVGNGTVYDRSDIRLNYLADIDSNRSAHEAEGRHAISRVSCHSDFDHFTGIRQRLFGRATHQA